ncbi:MAG: phosphatase PAP2 family protein [Chitinophagaceae bacterium]|nr:MAG: phosphatase PAP2 family protein [Chitinophagaceae bacterium]
MTRIYRCLLVVLCFLVQTAVQAQNADINLLKSINNNESSFKNSFFKADAQSVAIINIAAPAALFIAGELKHNKQLKKDALYMTGAFVLSSVITQATKRIVQRERPFDKYSFIVKRSSGGGYSFPSGHTSAAFTTATSLSLLFPKWYVVVPAFLWAGSVGYARMYQGVHYPSDVLAGALVGAGSAWLGWKVQKWMDHKHHTKK